MATSIVLGLITFQHTTMTGKNFIAITVNLFKLKFNIILAIFIRNIN